MKWVEQFLLSLRAIHIKGDEPKTAWLSRHRVNSSNWCLNQKVFDLVIKTLGLPSTDLFANCTKVETKILHKEGRSQVHGDTGLIAQLAAEPTLHVSTLSTTGESGPENETRTGDVNIDNFSLPEETLVLRPDGAEMEYPLLLPWRLDILSQGPLLNPDPKRLQLTERSQSVLHSHCFHLGEYQH